MMKMKWLKLRQYFLLTRSLRTISMANIMLKTKLLISTVLVSQSGWSWYSMPMLKVLIRMQKRMKR